VSHKGKLGGITLDDLLLLKHYKLNLQLFANPEDEGRTEEPTERRKREKREEGEVAKSQDLSSAFVFFFSFLGFWVFFEYFISSIIMALKHYLGHVDVNILADGEKGFIAIVFFKGILPICTVAIIAAIVINVVQAGFLITPKAITPKLSRISFSLKKFREKIFFSKPVMLNLVFSLGRILFLSLIFIFLIRLNLKEVLNLSGMGVGAALITILKLVLKMFFISGIFLILLGIPDYFAKRKQFKDSLKITKSEAKREHRQEEGDPQVKGYLREMYNKILQKQSIRTRVPEADVIITNPTHFAVALKYDMNTMDSPMVVAKGEDDTALLIRETATEYGIQIIENPPLARELYKLLNVGDFIPEHLTMVIAEIFVQLYKDGKWNWQNEELG
jgi:flagellar biosynthetic protein FlhB